MTSDQSEAMKFLEDITEGPLNLSGLLRAIRLCEDMTQVEFAKMLSISKSYLSDVETGRKNVSVEKAAFFARLLGHSEVQFVRLALEGALAKAGLKYNIKLSLPSE
jgi:transcriptional regulator with XRE-family HTH domain